MARIFISTNKKHVNDVVELNQKAGFTDSIKYNSESFSLVIFKKKIHPVENFLEGQNGDFVAMVGTGFYNGKNGLKALEGILLGFDGDVLKLQENIIGNYLLVIHFNSELYILTDKYQVIKSYYTEYETGWAVSNNLSDLIAVGNYLKKESIDYYGLLSESFLVSSFSKKTIVTNISKVFGFEFIIINKNNEFHIHHIGHKKNNYDLSCLSKVEIAEQYASYIHKYIKVIVDNFGESIGIHQTGGLDNRTILAAFLNKNIKPTMLYGIGNSPLTNTQSEDLKVVRVYEKELGLKLSLMDWSNDKNWIQNQNWKERFDKFGFLYSIYGGSESFFNAYENKDKEYPECMECGYFLENLRLREFAKDMSGAITLEQFVDQYLLGGGYGISNETIISDLDGYRKHIIEELASQIEIYSIDISKGITKENFDEIRWIHARHTDTIMVNFLNLYTSSFSIFSQPDLHEYPFSVSSEFRSNAGFQLMVIKSLHSKLLEFPFYTHQRLHSFDYKKMELTPIMSFKEVLEEYLVKNFGENITNFIRLIYKKTRKIDSYEDSTDFKKIINDSVSDIIANSMFSKEVDLKVKSPLAYNMIFAQNLKAIEYLNSDKT